MKPLLFVFLVCVLPAHGDELGRLFTSSEQRASLEQARGKGHSGKPLEESSRGFFRKKGSGTILRIRENSVDEENAEVLRNRRDDVSQEGAERD